MSDYDFYHIYISRVFEEFGTVSFDLNLYLRTKGMDSKIQVQTRQEVETPTTLDELERHVSYADAVIALVGVQSGGYPPDEAAAKWKHLLPPGVDRATYTQWEVHFARHFKKRLKIFLGFRESDGVILYPAESTPEPATDDPTGQSAYVRRLIDTPGLDVGHFTDADQLCRAVLEDWPEFPRFKPWNLPYRTLGNSFVGRKKLLADIRSDLQRARAAGRHDPNHVIWGLGGIGKTRAAVEYAIRNEKDYSALLFISGESEEKLTRNIAALTSAFQSNMKREAPTGDQLRKALDWLQNHPGWLLIINDVDSPEAVEAVQKRLADLIAGHVIITSRQVAWRPGVIKRKLEIISTKDAVRYFLTSTRYEREPEAAPGADATEAAALADDLDHNPLAMTIAAELIVNRPLSFSAYRAKLAALPALSLDFLDETTAEFRKSVARAWLITVEGMSPPARELQRILSWFDTEPIHYMVLTRDRVTGEAIDDCSAIGLVGELFYSIHWLTPGSFQFRHRLIREITRQQQVDPQPPPALRMALEWMCKLFDGNPKDADNWPVMEYLAQHAQAIAFSAADHGIPEPTINLLCVVGAFHAAQARHQAAERLMRRAVAIAENSFGKDRPEVAHALRWLTDLLRAMNRMDEAEPLMRRTLAIDETFGGKDHPKVAADLLDLGILLIKTDRLAEAEPLLRRALAIREASPGMDHPSIAASLIGLARLFSATGRLAEAESLMRRAVAITESSINPDQSAVAASLSWLANLLKATDRVAEAESLTRRYATIFLKLTVGLGHSHPHLLGAIYCYIDIGRKMNLSKEELFARILAMSAEAGISCDETVVKQVIERAFTK